MQDVLQEHVENSRKWKCASKIYGYSCSNQCRQQKGRAAKPSRNESMFPGPLRAENLNWGKQTHWRWTMLWMLGWALWLQLKCSFCSPKLLQQLAPYEIWPLSQIQILFVNIAFWQISSKPQKETAASPDLIAEMLAVTEPRCCAAVPQQSRPLGRFLLDEFALLGLHRLQSTEGGCLASFQWLLYVV